MEERERIYIIVQIQARTTYGLRRERATVNSRIVAWSNGSAEWGVTSMKVPKGEFVELDANQILVPDKHIREMEKMFRERRVPAHPLFKNSYEARSGERSYVEQSE